MIERLLRFVVAPAIVAMLAAACFSPDYGQRPFTCPDGACPSGYVCSEGVCVTAGSEKDAGADHAEVPDGPWPDAMPILLPVRISETTNGTSAPCQPDEFAVGGGVSCPEGAVKQSRTTTGGDWLGASTEGTPTKVTAYCVQRDALSGLNAPVKIETPSATADCSSAKPLVLVGGSCQCPGGRIIASIAEAGTDSWRCECDTGQAVAAAHCVSLEATVARGLVRDTEAISEAGRSFAICPPESVAIGGGCASSITKGFTQIGNGDDSMWFECRPASNLVVFCLGSPDPIPARPPVGTQ